MGDHPARYVVGSDQMLREVCQGTAGGGRLMVILFGISSDLFVRIRGRCHFGWGRGWDSPQIPFLPFCFRDTLQFPTSLGGIEQANPLCAPASSGGQTELARCVLSLDGFPLSVSFVLVAVPFSLLSALPAFSFFGLLVVPTS